MLSITLQALYAACHIQALYAECHIQALYVECHIKALNECFMLNFVMLGVIRLSVVAS